MYKVVQPSYKYYIDNMHNTSTIDTLNYTIISKSYIDLY